MPQGFFKSSQGLGQGNPLSPPLFVFVMEAFSKIISNVLEDGSIYGFSMGEAISGTLNISHLLFTNYTQIFCGASHVQLRALMTFLLCFEAILGLK